MCVGQGCRGRAEAESRKLAETKAGFRHRHARTRTRTHTHTHAPRQTHSHTQKHTFQQVITNTLTQITGVQSHTWNQTWPQAHPGSGARLSARPAWVGHRLDSQVPSAHWAQLARTTGALGPWIQRASEAFPPKKRSYYHHHHRPLPNRSLRSLRPLSPGGLLSPCLHLAVPQRSLRSPPACPRSLMTLTTMRSQRRGRGPQLP